MSTAPTVTPEPIGDNLLALCARIFALRFQGGYSLEAIAKSLRARGYSISSETVRKILLGEAHGTVTEQLRKRYPPYEQSQVEELTAYQLLGVFVDYHERRYSLSRIASALGKGYDYNRVRRILQGEGEYGEPTEVLRGRFPAYKQRTGRRARDARSIHKATIGKVFRVYFEDQASLDETHRVTGVPKGRVKALIEGRETPEKTIGLRARYGSTLRYAGPPSGPRWHQARGLDPAATG